MPRLAKELGALEVKRLTAPGYHFVGKVAGLVLQVSDTGARSWLLRVKIGNKRREIGLGAYPGVTLATVHETAAQLRKQIKDGADPVLERANARRGVIQKQIEDKAKAWTFRLCAEAYIKATAPGWRNAKHEKQWTSTLEKYAYPTIGEMLVSAIAFEDVLAIVEPHWMTRNETINRVRNRIELVLDWATVRRYREGDNPARWKGNLDKQLAKRRNVAPVKSHQALPAEAMHGFMVQLRKLDTTGARCLEFAVLNASRSGEARLATWDEIDLRTRTWTIPAVRMKSQREHKVPLSDQAVKLLESLPRFDDEPLIFPGRKAGTPLSDMTLTKILRDMAVGAVPHGFRSTFSTWVASSTSYPSEVREMALAHAVGDHTVAAYQRSDLFEKRRNLMCDWANFADTPQIESDNIIQLRSASPSRV
ncbi:tyrosine-type recombinase/integrase [Actimicrobium antarcticum]|uniref:Site-specific integrase n=1 Tax=Actimicrobium antarcticum TaxID=1051899 RepID=A0ABP7SUM3_9BURK